MKINPESRTNKTDVSGDRTFGRDGRLSSGGSPEIIAALKAKVKLQHLISGISAKFVSLPAEKVDKEIYKSLEFILDFMGLDRCLFGEFTENKKSLQITHSIQKPGIDALNSYPVDERYPWLGRKLLDGDVVAIEKTSDIPAEAINEIDYCRKFGLKSILTIPVSVGGSLTSAIAFETFEKYHPWPEDTIEQLRIIGEVFANSVYRRRSEVAIKKHIQDLRTQFDFEQLISGISARFVKAGKMKISRQIEQSQKLLVEYLDVDRSMFFQISKDRTALIPVTGYSVAGVERLENIPILSWFPWAAKKLLQEEIVSFSSEDELPAEADFDRSNLSKIGLKASILVPISIDGNVTYVLSVGSVRKAGEWPKGIASRLKLIGEIFVNALIRAKNLEIMQKNEKELTAAYHQIAKISKDLARENRYYREEINAEFQSNQIIGESSGLKYIFYRLRQVARTDTTVLIQGETGTGKELIARALHELSNRKDRPLIKIDCASLPGSVIESELFGHEKGSFTGANERRIGRIELADEATIFLDEVGEIPLPLQSKILRVIESGEFERLGSTATKKVHMRLIAATNRNLADEVKNGNFRQDLFYRLNVFPLTLPPLRERKEDIPVLIEWFINIFNNKMGKNITRIPDDILKALKDYSWPGNVRELKNVIERAMIISEGPALKLLDVLKVQNSTGYLAVAGQTLHELELNYIIKILEETKWRIEGQNGAAQKLGLHPDTLRSRIKKLGIRRPPPEQ